MEFYEVINARFSSRAYRQQAVPEDALARILEAFATAPTTANRQALGLVVIETAGREDALKRINSAAWFHSQAPLVLAACSIPNQGWKREDGETFADVDVAIALDHLVLAATAEGLGTCWVGAFDYAAAREVLGLPEGVEPVAFTPLGYSADVPRGRREKRPASELVHHGRW
jgi:nitroreductase